MLTRRGGLQPVDAADIAWITDEGVHHVTSGDGQDMTEVWCGFLGTERSSAHPLLEALPPGLKVDLSSGKEDWVEASLRFVAEQVPSAEVVGRLAESFVAQAIRDYLDTLPWVTADGLRACATPLSPGRWQSFTSAMPRTST